MIVKLEELLIELSNLVIDDNSNDSTTQFDPKLKHY